MRFIFLFLFICCSTFAQIKIVSWNVQNFGNSKSDSVVAYMASVVKSADIIALQEMISTHGGFQTVARFAKQLNRSGDKWDYVVSKATSGQGSERYAFLWKTSKIKLKNAPWLDLNFANYINREPYFGTFIYNKKEFTLASFHAVPKKKQPEAEIKYFKYYPQLYPRINLIFLGDFNCPQRHSVFNPLKKMGWKPALTNQRTTLKMQCQGNQCLASEYDNFIVPSCIAFKAGVIPFYKDFSTPKKARKISDHLPIYIIINPK